MKKIILIFSTLSTLAMGLVAEDTVHYDKRVEKQVNRPNHPICDGCTNNTIKTNHSGM